MITQRLKARVLLFYMNMLVWLILLVKKLQGAGLNDDQVGLFLIFLALSNACLAFLNKLDLDDA